MSMSIGSFWCIGILVEDIILKKRGFLAITFFVVGNEVFVVPVLAEIGNQGEFINLELLVLRRMRIIKSPLLERDISADK